MSELRIKSTGTIKLFENDNTSNVTIASPASLTTDRTITLPDGDVTLVAGTMSTGGVALTGSTNNQVTTVTGADAIVGETNLTFDGTQLSVLDTNEGTDNLLVKTTADGSISMALEKSDLKYDLGLDHNNDGSQNFYIRERTKDGSTTNAVRLIIDSAGKVGIGTTGAGAASTGKVSVSYGSGGTMPESVTAANSYVALGNNEYGASAAGKVMIALGYTGGAARTNAPAYIGYEEVLNSGYTKGNLTFYTRDVTTDTAPTKRMTIDSNGDVGIGTTDPVNPLHVSIAASASIARFHNTNTSNGGTLFKIKCDNTTAGDYVFFNIDKAGYSQLNIMGDGDVENVNNSYGAISDERIKKDITDANSQWEDIKALKVKNYKLKADNTESTQLGVIAQDLETANMNGLIREQKPDEGNARTHSDFGTIVSGTEDNGATPIKDDDGNITGYEDVFTEGEKVKAVKYSVLYMKAIKCLQEAMEKIETLETSNTDLTTRLETLETANTNKDTAIADLTTRLEALENA